MSRKKKILIVIPIFIIVFFTVYFIYYLNNSQAYNKFVSDGDHAVTAEQYDKAITLYEEALKYKKDADVNQKIKIAKLLEKSKEIYNTAVNQMASKDYLTAIDTFKKVDKQDTKRYKTAQSKIDECKKLYIADNLKSANDSLSSKNFDNANKYVANIFKIDSDNADAKKVKDSIAKAIQKQKDDVAAAQTAKSQQVSNGTMSFEQALHIAGNSNYFQEECKGTTKVMDTQYEIQYKYPDNASIELILGEDTFKNPHIVSDQDQWLSGFADCPGWAIVKGKTVYFIVEGDTNATRTSSHTGQGYLVEVSTGKLYRWDSGLVTEVN